MIEILDSFRRFRRVVNQLAVQALKPLGLGTKQASMLRYLAGHRRCSHADLARHTITDPAATGRILDTLIRRGLVVREEHPSDRRCWMLSLTPKGRHLDERVVKALEWVSVSLAGPLAAGERRTLVAALDKVSDAFAPAPAKGR